MPPAPSPSGVPATSAVLQGWTIPLRRFISGRPGYFHHTYVTSDLGDRWSCAGRDQGGTSICRGGADIRVVRCLARGNGRAGILYGVTGVCHQIANRILHPASQIKVHRAVGYGLSVGVYGEYGVGPWPSLTACYGSNGFGEGRPEAGSRIGPASSLQRFPQRGAEWRSTGRSTMSEAESDGRAQSLRNLLLGHEGPPIPDEVARSVVQRHEAFWNLQDELVEHLVTEQIDRRQYLNAFNREVIPLAGVVDSRGFG